MLWREFLWTFSYILINRKTKISNSKILKICIFPDLSNFQIKCMLCINNFKMKSKNQRQKDKQKHQLIFKYVKSLTPFSNPEAQTYLQKLRTGQTQKKESILLNSKVFEVSVLASKHKKKVSFIDEPRTVNHVKTNPKQKMSNHIRMGGKQDNHIICSPERVQSDLIQLQRSIFTTFKIKNEQRTEISYSSTKHIPYQIKNQSDYYSNRNPQAATFNQKLQTTTVVRAKSCSSISNLGIQSSVKSKETQTASSIMLNSAKSSFLFRSQSQTNPVSLSKTESELSNRSDIFSQQSHNLMVEIFRQKLQAKQGKRTS